MRSKVCKRTVISRSTKRHTENEKNYNSHITLTESGKELAKSILNEGLSVQAGVREGISDEELVAFYGTLAKLYENIKKVTVERESAEPSSQVCKKD